MKIGIPRALLYYIYIPLWKNIFEELGHEVVISSETTKTILDNGVKNCVDDACLPIKLFHGHVMDLIGKADKIFIPRLISTYPGEYICPKFIGLPEMIRSSVKNLPDLIIVDINAHKSLHNMHNNFISIENKTKDGKLNIKKAVIKGDKIHREFLASLTSNNLMSSLGIKKYDKFSNKKGTIAIIGHPYLLYDEYVSMNLILKLMNKGYGIITPENFIDTDIDSACSHIPKRMFWSYGKKLLGGALHALEHCNIKGMIYLSSFGCGIDSFIEELVQRYNQRKHKLPYMTITLDEHSGQAGFNTRLEAFLDMMEWRFNNDNNISPYGKNVYSSKSTV